MFFISQKRKFNMKSHLCHSNRTNLMLVQNSPYLSQAKYDNQSQEPFIQNCVENKLKVQKFK